jgi:N-acetylglucosamine malate deacetylase 1
VNVLVIAPHPDDEAIGCGGAITLHTGRGDRVAAAFLTSGELGLQRLSREEAWQVREREAEAAAAVLGITSLTFLRRPDCSVWAGVHETAAMLRPILESEAPRLVYLPHDGEAHPDHQAALSIVRVALQKDLPVGLTAPVLLTYEVWTPLSAFDQVQDITPVMARKLTAVRCYTSQTNQHRYDRAVRGLNQYRGALAAQCRYAEVFQLVELRPG